MAHVLLGSSHYAEATARLVLPEMPCWRWKLWISRGRHIFLEAVPGEGSRLQRKLLSEQDAIRSGIQLQPTRHRR